MDLGLRVLGDYAPTPLFLTIRGRGLCPKNNFLKIIFF